MAERIIPVPTVADFALDGSGDEAGWGDSPWLDMARVNGASAFGTRCRLARSTTGFYLAVDCEDTRLDTTGTKDGDDLFNGDVVELFLQPDPAVQLYLEYELSPLGCDLLLIVPRRQGRFHGWLGWKAAGKREVRRAVRIRGGAQAPGATVSGWSATCFVPWTLFACFADMPVAPGTVWRGNVYRIDAAGGAHSHWALHPETGFNFHNVEGFGGFRLG